MKNVEELRNTFFLAVAAFRVTANECRAYKARTRRQVARKSHSAHSSAERFQRIFLAERVHGLFRRKSHILGEIGELFGKFGVVRENANRVVVHVKAFFGGFHDNRTAVVRNHPVQLAYRVFLAERLSDKRHCIQKFASLSQIRAVSENIRDKFVRRDCRFSRDRLAVKRVSDKI